MHIRSHRGWWFPGVGLKQQYDFLSTFMLDWDQFYSSASACTSEIHISLVAQHHAHSLWICALRRPVQGRSAGMVKNVWISLSIDKRLHVIEIAKTSRHVKARDASKRIISAVDLGTSPQQNGHDCPVLTCHGKVQGVPAGHVYCIDEAFRLRWTHQLLNNQVVAGLRRKVDWQFRSSHARKADIRKALEQEGYHLPVACGCCHVQGGVAIDAALIDVNSEKSLRP
mmetsp:Transcript_846/g.1651  ORF Transcript_846/g.1651 Transcript_846/m.1651 type:complete len:226 (+) Transcript_846:148-825(+)